jgi:hypothetical protein
MFPLISRSTISRRNNFERFIYLFGIWDQITTFWPSLFKVLSDYFNALIRLFDYHERE